MRIGIVGAENSHCAAVARTLNVDQSCGRARVVAVWGETRAFAQQAAETGEIPQIVEHPEEMMGEIDGVMVDHRHPKYHIPAATPFVEAGIPAFVDKPFAANVREGWKFIQLARKKGVAVTSFSVIPEQRSFKDLRKQIRSAGDIRSITTTGACDLTSKYGGIFFYGIHQVDAILKAFGPGIGSVEVVKATGGNPNAVAVLRYRDGGPVVAMHCVAEGKVGFTFRASGTKGTVDHAASMDPNPYLSGIKTFLRMFRTGKEPFMAAEMLEPIAVLEALQRSIDGNKPARVRQLPC
jgi:predicted dehydrogenase